MILAGGLTPENVADAIERVQPVGRRRVDRRRVERARVARTPRKVRGFIANARGRRARAATTATRDDRPYDWMEE